MIAVDFNQQVGGKIPKQFWSVWLGKLNRALGLKRRCAVSIAVVDGPTIRRLNRMYRGKDAITDVLSFSEAEGEGGNRAGEYLGEIVICYSRAVAQAKEHQHSLRRELAILVVHGCLHLLGYDHVQAKDAKKMRRLEIKILGDEPSLA